MTFLWWIVVGLIAGWITGKIMGSGHGVLIDILVGIAGALFGGWVMRMLGFAGHGGSTHLPVPEMRRRLKAMLERYRRAE